MTHSLPPEFYLVVHDFEGAAYGGLLSTNEGPLSITREAAHDHLSEIIQLWPRTRWQVFHVKQNENTWTLTDVGAEFEDEREAEARAHDREINGLFDDPDREHRLTAWDLGVGIFNTF